MIRFIEFSVSVVRRIGAYRDNPHSMLSCPIYYLGKPPPVAARLEKALP
jgi:hypothetical protein